MRPKSILLLALALGCGLIASWGISDVMERNAKHKAVPAVETEPIYVALKDINVNEALTPELIKLEEWPKDKVPHDAVRLLDEITGRRAGTKLYEGEPIRGSRTVLANQTAASNLPKGYRPFPVRVSAETSAAGLIKSGDKVDVQLFVKRNPALGIEETRTQTIMSQIRVFAVDQVYNRTSEDQEAHVIASTISLMVTTEQANKLSLASRIGELNLMLRHPDDEEVAEDVASVSDLLGGLEEGDREAERESAGGTAANILQKLKDMKNAAAEQIGPETVVEVTPVVDVAPPHQMMVLRGNEIEVIEFPTDGSLPSNMPAAKSPRTLPRQPAQGLTTTTSAAPAATHGPVDGPSLEQVNQPEQQETNGDSIPPELDDFSTFDINAE